MFLLPMRVIGASGTVDLIVIGRETRGVGVSWSQILPWSDLRDQ